MDCGTPAVLGCNPLNFEGYMHPNIPGPLGNALQWGTVGPSNNPTPGGSLTAPATAGTNVLHIWDISIYRLADRIRINPGGSNQEDRTITGFGSLILDAPLQFDHSASEPVVTLPSAPVSVGGIAEAPDVTALAAQTSTTPGANGTAYALGGAAAAAFALAAAGGWAMRRRRGE